MSETGYIALSGSSWADRFIETPLATSGASGGIINLGKLWTPQPSESPESLGKLYYTDKTYSLGKYEFTLVDPVRSLVNISVRIPAISTWYLIPSAIAGFYFDMLQDMSCPSGSDWNFQMTCKITNIKWGGSGAQSAYIKFEIYQNSTLRLSTTQAITSLSFYNLTATKKAGLSFNNGDQLIGRLYMGYFDDTPD